MTGFSNPIVNPQGKLVIPQVMSPNFNLANPAASPNPSWAILKNGLAYFFGLVLAGGTITGPDYIINSDGAFFYNGAPALGNLAESVAAAPGTDSFGNAYLTGFTSYSLSGTRVAVEQAANGWTFSTAASGAGPWAVAGSLTWGALFSTLALTGNWIVSGNAEFDGTITLVNGTQVYTITTASGNAHPIFPAEIELAEVAVTPSTPGSGIKVFSDASGIPRAVGEDGSLLSLGARTVMFTGTQAITLVAFTTLNDGTNNLSSNVGSGRKYKIRARVYYQAAGAVGAPAFHVTAPASSGGIAFDFDFNGNASGICRYDNASGFGNSEAGPANNAALIVTLDITGTASFSAAGTVAVAASIGAGGNSGITIVQGSFLEVSPI